MRKAMLGVLFCLLTVSCDVGQKEYRERWSAFVSSVKVGEALVIPNEFARFVSVIEDRPEYTKYLINTDANHNDMWVCVKGGKVVSIWAEKWSAAR